jgi:transposase
MLTVGIDVHQRFSTVCVLNQQGAVMLERSVKGSASEVVKVLQDLGQPMQICYEASIGYGALYDRLATIASRVVVAHPGHLRLIFRSKKKNDRVDARRLAMLLLLGQVPGVYVPRIDVRQWRTLIEHRRRLVDKRTRAKNGIRAILRSLSIKAPPRRGLWAAPGRAWLSALELSDADALRRDILMEEVEHFDRTIKRVEKQLDAIAARHPAVALLTTIPGVGPRTAELFAAYVDDPRRFSNLRSIGSYFGLVPCQDQSGTANRLGHITRDGPVTARKYLVEAAWRGIQLSPTIKAHFERICGGQKDRRKIALVATGRHLACIMLSMMKTGAVWQEKITIDPSGDEGGVIAA